MFHTCSVHKSSISKIDSKLNEAWWIKVASYKQVPSRFKLRVSEVVEAINCNKEFFHGMKFIYEIKMLIISK